MKRDIQIRSRKITFEDVDQTIAVRVEMEDVRNDPQHSDVLAGVAKRTWDVRSGESPVAPAELEPFLRAGWSFVEPLDEAMEAVRSGARRENLADANARRVMRVQETGEIVIGTDRVVVRAVEDATNDYIQEMLQKHDLQLKRRLGFGHLYHAEVVSDRDPFDVVEELAGDSAVDVAEPELIEHIPARLRPTDPLYPRQWQHDNAGRDLGSERAWDVNRGQGVRVAVIDNGFDVLHEDLKPALDPASGYYVEDPSGDATFRRTLVGFPSGRHGTFCAGMAAARGQNKEGVCGVAFEANLLLVACLVDQVASQVTLARAIAYAADPSTEVDGADPRSGGHVIACSLGPNGANWILKSVLEDAIQFVTEEARDGAGVPLLWAATNGDFEIRHDEVCSHPNVMAVSRMRRNDLHDGAAHGAGLEFVAPGVDVFSTTQGGYAFGTGCSYAAPAAAGVAALVLAQDASLSAAQVREVLRGTCREVGGVTYDGNGWHERYGFGCVSAEQAVRAVPSGIRP